MTADSRVSRVQYEEACRLLRERTGQLSDAQDRADRAEALLEEVTSQRDELASQLGIEPEWTEADA